MCVYWSLKWFRLHESPLEVLTILVPWLLSMKFTAQVLAPLNHSSAEEDGLRSADTYYLIIDRYGWCTIYFGMRAVFLLTVVITLSESIQALLLKYMPREKEGNWVLLSLRWHSVWRCIYVYFLPERRTISGSQIIFSFTLVSFLIPQIQLLFLELWRVPHEIQITHGMRCEILHIFFFVRLAELKRGFKG